IDEFTFIVYYPSNIGLDSTHQVIKFLRENVSNKNVLYVGSSSIIPDYLLGIRRMNDYIINPIDNSFISIQTIREKLLLNWPSSGTFVLMTHLVRDDFGPIADDMKGQEELILTRVPTTDLFDGDTLLESSSFVRNL